MTNYATVYSKEMSSGTHTLPCPTRVLVEVDVVNATGLYVSGGRNEEDDTYRWSLRLTDPDQVLELGNALVDAAWALRRGRHESDRQPWTERQTNTFMALQRERDDLHNRMKRMRTAVGEAMGVENTHVILLDSRNMADILGDAGDGSDES